MMKILKRIWRAVPSGVLKTKIHCAFYRGQGFSFHYRKGLFVTKGPNGILMYTKEAPFNLIKYTRLFFKHYTPQLSDIVIDAGAYNGHVSILMAKWVGASGRVISFEPDPGNYALTQENIKLNDCKNILLLDKGLWQEESVLEFNSNSSKASSVYYQANDANQIRVKVTSLDLFYQQNNIQQCNFIKMNIEGSEIMALNGANQLLDKLKPNLVITTDHVVDGQQTTLSVESILKLHHYNTWTETIGSAKVTYAK
jgi:FkbM family methyltransferase